MPDASSLDPAFDELQPDLTGDERGPQPIAWMLLLVPAVAHLLLHLFSNGRYGIFRDEYYYLACANRLAWGYVDQPPLSIWILAAWKSAFGDSVHSIRILPALCGSGLIVLAGALAAEFGGRRWAQFLAALGVAVGAAGLVIFGFYSMNAYDLLFWTAAYLLVVRVARTGDGRWWIWLGLLLGIGLFNKVGLVVFGAALAIGLVITPHRHHLKDRRLWLGGGLALIFLVPYVLWNAANDWAAYEFIENAKRYKIADISPLEFLKENVLESNPMTLPIWLGGLLWLLMAKRARRFRIVGIMFLLSFVIMVLQKSKPYYLAPSYPVLIAAGGVAWEGWTSMRRWQWGRWALAGILLAGGFILAPGALPLLPIDDAIAYMQRLGIVPTAAEVGHTSAAPQYFSDRFGWEELAQEASRVYSDLPPQDRENAVIVGRNYGHAGALEYWSRTYDLPPVYSSHNNYWMWGPPPEDASVFLITGNDRDRLLEIFEEVEAGGERVDPDALESRLTIWICRGLKAPMPEVWADAKSFI